jgi:hypothetical protein
MIAALQTGQYRTLRCNYANGDMVGHTGTFRAATMAIEAVYRRWFSRNLVNQRSSRGIPESSGFGPPREPTVAQAFVAHLAFEALAERISHRLAIFEPELRHAMLAGPACHGRTKVKDPTRQQRAEETGRLPQPDIVRFRSNVRGAPMTCDTASSILF